MLLGRRADMVPRDTVYHYGPWNPPGIRQRMYTGDPEEDVLIHSVRMAAPSLATCLDRLVAASQELTDSRDLANFAGQAASHLEALVDSIDFVRAALTPLFFARTLRPNFEDIRIEGHRYLGPAAANLPLYLVDHLLWSSDRHHPEHYAFQQEAADHSPADWRELFRVQDGAPSLVTRISHALEAQREDASPEATAGAEAICRLLRILVTFRGRHRATARADEGAH